jgi:hypothetical protein
MIVLEVHSMNKKIHETQPDRPSNRDEIPMMLNELGEMQEIEGGGPPKKVHLQDMPGPIRAFGYFFIGCLVVLGMVLVFLVLFDR